MDYFLSRDEYTLEYIARIITGFIADTRAKVLDGRTHEIDTNYAVACLTRGDAARAGNKPYPVVRTAVDNIAGTSEQYVSIMLLVGNYVVLRWGMRLDSSAEEVKTRIPEMLRGSRSFDITSNYSHLFHSDGPTASTLAHIALDIAKCVGGTVVPDVSGKFESVFQMLSSFREVHLKIIKEAKREEPEPRVELDTETLLELLL